MLTMQAYLILCLLFFVHFADMEETILGTPISFIEDFVEHVGLDNIMIIMDEDEGNTQNINVQYCLIYFQRP
jgi:hypothetical protein